MQLTGGEIQLKQSLADESFSTDSIKNYKLFFEAGSDYLCACVLNPFSNMFIAFEDFRFNQAISAKEHSEKCEIARQQSRILTRDDYLSVSCCVTMGKSTIVPEPLYDKGNEKIYFDFNYSNPAEDETFLC